jgi:aminoglycoside phosphotransferase (APT) family kinase protein
MDVSNLVLLKLLERELSKTLAPATNSAIARLIATLAGGLVSRRLVEQTSSPAFREAAANELRALLPELSGAVDAELYADASSRIASACWPEIDVVLQKMVSRLLAKRVAASNKLAGELIAIDARLRERQEAAYRERVDSVSSVGEQWDPSKFSVGQQSSLLQFIRQRFPSEADVVIASVDPLAGGFSKQTVFINLLDTVSLPGSIVLRRDPPYVTSGSSVTTEYAVLEKMYAASVPVAQPLALEDTGRVLGTKFMLSTRVDGSNIGDSMVVPRNPEVAADLARAVALIHAVGVKGLESLLPGGTTSVRERVLAEIKVDDESWKGLRHFQSYTVQAALDWLRLNIDLADGPKVISHRDIGMHNVLVHDNKITGILDWETVAIGTRAEDLGMLYNAATQLSDWETFIRAYEKEAGVQMDRRQLDYYVIATLIRILLLVARLGDAVLSEKLANIQLMYVGDCIKENLIGRVASKLAQVLARN